MAGAPRASAPGKGLTMVGKLAGRTPVQTTAHHAHVARDSMRNATSRITGGIGGNRVGDGRAER